MSPSASPSGRRLRILSANVLNGSALPEAIAGLCRDRDVDVAALQELSADQAEAVAAVLPHGKLEPASNYCGMGIALRHPGEVTRLPLRHRDARVARISPGDWPALPGLVEILNVHVQAPHAGLPWTAFGRRRAQVRALCSALADPGPGRRLLVGDLNATPLWPAYRRLVEHLPDVIHRHAREKGEPPPRTWGPWSGSPRLLRIDHVLGVGVRAVACEAVHLAGSDHSAVIVDLELADAARQEP